MAFAGRCGLDIDLSSLTGEALEVLFNEEAGAVLQIADADLADFLGSAAKLGLAECTHTIGKAIAGDALLLRDGERESLRRRADGCRRQLSA